MPTKNRHNSLTAAAQSAAQKKEAAARTVVSAADRDNALVRLLFHKLYRNDDHAAVLDEFVRYCDCGSVNQIRIDDGSTFPSVARNIASEWDLPTRPALHARDAILQTLGWADVLVVRDLNRLAGSGEREKLIVDFLREIRDVTGCSLVLEYASTYRLDEQLSRRICFTAAAKAK